MALQRRVGIRFELLDWIVGTRYYGFKPAAGDLSEKLFSKNI